MKSDMTTGNIWKPLLAFAVPLMLGNLLQQLYNTVDGIVVGNYVGESALAAVGTSNAPILVFIAFAIGMSGGCGILISQLYGARRMEELRRTVSTSLILMIAIGIFLAILGTCGARFAMHTLLNVAEGELLDQAVTYFAIYCLGLPFQFTYNSISSILRAVGDSKPTLYFLVITSVLNTVLDLLFVIVFHWGVAGAAIATVLSQVVCTVASLVYMFRKYEMFRFQKGEFVFDGQKCLACLRLSIPTTVQQCVVSFSNMALQRLINGFGQTLIAACTVAMRIENYIFIPVFAMQISISTFAGQNMGAGKIERIGKGRRAAAVIAISLCAILAVISFSFASPIATLFGVEEQALTYTVEYLHFLSFFVILFAYYQTYAGTLQGTGDVLYATLCTLVSLVCRISFVYLAVYVFHLGYKMIWQTMPFGWFICTAMAAIRFWRGKWKTKGLIKEETP